MTRLEVGELAPWFTAPSPSHPNFGFSNVAGRYVLMGFLPDDPERRAAALAAVNRRRDLLNDRRAACFLVARDPDSIAAARDTNGLRWFLDREGTVSRLYGALDEDGRDNPAWLLLDPAMRVMAAAPIEDAEAMLDRVARLGSVDDYAGTAIPAPVLIVPRVLEPDLCRRLIDLYNAHGGAASGVMREVGGKTVGVLDDFKKRRDAPIEDPALRGELRSSLVLRLLPEIERVFQFRATRLERYIVACYDAESGGYFRPHRDNTTLGTAHRQFAVSINLNAEAFEGGDLRFPEFGQRTYRPPTGGAVVFCCSLLHEATAVTLGTRYAFLPFLYDEAAQRVRDANLAHLASGPVASPAVGGDVRPQETARPQG